MNCVMQQNREIFVNYLQYEIPTRPLQGGMRATVGVHDRY